MFSDSLSLITKVLIPATLNTIFLHIKIDGAVDTLQIDSEWQLKL